jgi:hypothetical protein
MRFPLMMNLDWSFIFFVLVTLDFVGKMFALRVRKKWDVMCMVDGLPGTGKSTLIQGLAKRTSKWCRYVNPQANFNMKRDTVFYDEDHFRERWEYPGIGFNIIGDESISMLFCRDAMSWTSKRWIEEFAEGRMYGKVMWMLIPDRFKLDENVRDSRPTHWIYLTDRGTADFHVAHPKKFRKRGEPGIWWEQLDGIKFPAMPNKWDQYYTDLKKMAKKEYNKKMGYEIVIANCKRCKKEVKKKRTSSTRWELFEMDGQPHEPLCA